MRCPDISGPGTPFNEAKWACRAAAAMRAISMTPRDNVVGTPCLGLTGGLSQAAVAALTPRFFAAKEALVMSCSACHALFLEDLHSSSWGEPPECRGPLSS